MRVRSIIGAAAAGLAITSCGPADSRPQGVDERPDAVGQLECFDADYPVEPTFATPEEALKHAVASEGQAIAAMGAPEEYERIERAEGWIDFELHGEGEVHLTWGITRDGANRWGMTSLGGCLPARP